MYDAIILVSQEHIKQLLVNLDFIFNNLSANRVKIICKKDLTSYFPQNSLIDFLDENSIAFFNFNTIKTLLQNRGGDCIRTGWYFQQFLKMYYSFICKNKYYLIWDADTIPLSKIKFFTNDGKKMLFNRKKEHHIPYFETLDCIFNKKLKYERNSFISEGMIIDCHIMKELILSIDINNNIPGNNWIEKIINSISLKDLDGAGFSEFETYGTYLLNKYPEKYQERPLKTLRNGMSKYGKILSKKELSMLNFDTITFENWNRNEKISHKLKAYLRRLKLYKLGG